MDVENKYGTLEIQKGLLELIKKFDTFCNENGIRYSLNDGSLLGAIRHNGFIPWDDDLDIIVDRTNYYKLLNVPNINNYGISIKSKLWLDRIQLCNNTKLDNGNCFTPTLDVFILDIAPATRLHRKIKRIMIGFAQGMIKPKPDYSRFSMTNKLFSFITYIIGKLFTYEFKLKLYHKIAKDYGGKNSPYSSCYFEPFNDIGIIHKRDVLNKLEKHPFEDTEVSIISCYHEYLTEIYGDYMTPPIEENRIPIHIN